MLPELTPRQRQVLEVLLRTIQEQGYAPSLAEIASKLKISTKNGVKRHLDALERKRYIRRAGRRAIEILGAHGKPVLTALREIPVVGRIRAGLPVLADEHLEGYIAVPSDIARGKEVFALKVKGDSMNGAGILDGDRVIIKHQETAENGEIVCALIDGEATLKRFTRKAGVVTLKAENEKYPPITVSAGEFRILGRVVGLIRKF